jgi:hypothetical protein
MALANNLVRGRFPFATAELSAFAQNLKPSFGQIDMESRQGHLRVQ